MVTTIPNVLLCSTNMRHSSCLRFCEYP